MGLDVYLYEKAEEESSNASEKAWDEWYERFKDVPNDDEAKVAARDALRQSSGPTGVPSERYPEHLFNRRYLRSSYNGGGFNHAVPEFLGTVGDAAYPLERGSLYWIFEPVRGGSDEYSFELSDGSIAALEEAKGRALQVADELRKCEPLRTIDASCILGSQEHMWSSPPSEAQVLAWYREEKAHHAEHSIEGWFGTAKGMVFGFTEGVEVLALTVGRGVLGEPTAIAVYRGDASSYIESAEITAEFCDEAIALIRRDGAVFMHWSS